MWVGLIQLVVGLKSKDRFPKEERIQSLGYNIKILLELPAFRFKAATSPRIFISSLPACSTDFRLARPHSHVSQIFKINLSTVRKLES
jgi:hypothetical protein